MFRKLIFLSITCCFAAACSSDKLLSDAELDARTMKETMELRAAMPACMAGDAKQCEYSIEKTDTVLALMGEACSRSLSSAGCQAKPPIEMLAKSMPLYLDLANGDITALKKLSTVMLEESPDEPSADERADAAAEAAERAADAADIASSEILNGSTELLDHGVNAVDTSHSY